MHRYPLLEPLAVVAVVLCASVAHAEPEPGAHDAETDADSRSLTVEVWTAIGTAQVVSEGGYDDAEFMFMTGVLGLARFAPFEVGLCLDVGSQEDSQDVLLGPVFGVGFDIVRGFRFEGLLQLGGHFAEGTGYDWSYSDGTAFEESAWLLQGGVRVGLSARIGQELPRIVTGGWIVLIRDLTTSTTTISYPEGGSEDWKIGGTMGLVAVRLGMEW